VTPVFVTLCETLFFAAFPLIEKKPMALEHAARKNDDFMIVSMPPDVCLTPVGNAIVPIPYPIVAKLGGSSQVSPNVRFDGDPAFMHNESFVNAVKGDEPGSKGGVVTGTNKLISHAILHSPSVRVNGKPLVRTADQMWMNQRKP